MSELHEIRRCRDITDDHINAAIESRDDTRALLEHAVGIARPREAGARVLLVFARMATSACDWLDGALRVELAKDGDATAVESFAVIGAGLKERVFPRMLFNIPFEEFVLAIQKFPQAIVPLAMESTADSMTLSAAEAAKELPAEESEPSPRIPTPVAHLPSVDASVKAKPPKPLAKLKLRRSPALTQTVSEEIVTKPAGDSRRDSTGEHPALRLIEPPSSEPEKPEKTEADKDDLDSGWE